MIVSPDTVVGVTVGVMHSSSSQVGVGVGDKIPVGVGVIVSTGVGVGVDVGAIHVDLLTILLSKVTAPVRANALPSKLALVVSVIDVRASILPLKLVVVPSVAELPTCQKTWHD